MIKKIKVLFILSFALFMATSCTTAKITDLVHKDTEVGNIQDIKFSDPLLKKYQINGLLFVPYMVHNPDKSYNSDYENFSLKLATYKPIEDVGSNVKVNSVKIVGVKDINFTPISNTLNIYLVFKNEDKNPNLQVSEEYLVDEINNYNMQLNKESQLKVIINVSIEENGKIITEDLIYTFETNIREYLIQPT
jgi:hypothetical protein